MPRKKTGELAKRAQELEDAVARLFTGEGPAPKTSRKKKKRRSAKPSKSVRKTTRKTKKGARKPVAKAKRRARK